MCRFFFHKQSFIFVDKEWIVSFNFINVLLVGVLSLCMYLAMSY